MAKFVLREPFAIHLEWFESQGEGKKKVKREQSYFYGPNAIELNDADAIAHMHKLEPADDAAKKLFGDIQDKQDAARESRQAQDGNTKSMEERIATAVAVASAQIMPKLLVQALAEAGLVGKNGKAAPAGA